MRGTPIQLPSCGMFVGSGIYPMSADYMLCALHGHRSWAPQTLSPEESIDKIVEDNQGNLAQLWGIPRGYAPATIAQWVYALDEIGINVPPPNWETGENLVPQQCKALQEHPERQGAGFVRFVKQAAEKGLYTVFIYTSATPEWSSKLKDLGDRYLGYDFGERYSFSLDSASLKGKPLSDVTLKVLSDDLIERVRQHVEERRAAGWGNIYATSSNFHIDYEIVAGTDIPLVEDFAFRHLNMASALSRGLYRQFELPMWGSHMAHEHYSWIPASTPHKFDLMRSGMYQKYLSGCKMIINESGNFFAEASLCEDSPKFDCPREPLAPSDIAWGGKLPLKFIPYIEEARKHFHKIDYSSPYCRAYRKEISDFYDFVKAHGTPKGQPESTIAIAKGNHDICYHTFSPNNAIAGAYNLADINPNWFEGAPERGWDIVKEVFYPIRQVMEPYPNHFISGTPFGQVDIVTLVRDSLEAGFLSANYKALLFAGWNTCSEKQYEMLKQYVHAGGTILLSIPHLSTNIDRNYNSYSVEELVHKGDFSELCGVKVLGPGDRFYWSTAPYGKEEIIKFPRRFGILAARMAKVEITDPSVEAIIVDDEVESPVVLRRRYGKGTVYLVNSWAYPGALNTDEGPGARTYTKGMIGTLYQHIAAQCRGTVWITDDGSQTGRECEYVSFSYFPEDGTICLLNVDFQRPHKIHLHAQGTVRQVELKPGQFSMIRNGVQVDAKPMPSQEH